MRTALEVCDMNWVSIAPTDEPIPCRVKVRSAGKLVPATLTAGKAEFPSGIAGVAPGQSAVFYAADSEDLLCGGVIC